MKRFTEKTGQAHKDEHLKPVFCFSTPASFKNRAIQPVASRAFLFSSSDKINLYQVNGIWMGVAR